MKIRARTVTKLPASLAASGGLSVEKENGVWTFSPDWDQLALETTIADPEDRELWVKNANTDVYTRLSVQYLIDSLPDGPPGGFKQTFDSSTTDADPGDGDFRFNNATVASATEAYLDNEDADGTTITSILDQFDNSTSTIKGRIRFEKTTDPTVWAEFNVTGSVVDGTGYRKITLQDGVSNGTFSSGNRFAINFAASGNTPTVTVGSTTTLPAGSNATVTNSGTSSDLVLDFGVPRGADASFKWAYETSTSMAAPETGGMRFNNATLASVTAIAVNAETADNGNPDQSDYIVKWDDSTSTPKAYVEIREEAGSSAVYQLTSVTDNSTWLQLNVTYVSGDISLTEGDALYFTPHLVGNKGSDGTGVGDVVSDTATSVDSEIAIFKGTTGKEIQRATTTGVLKATSGVLAAAVAGTDYLAPAAIGVTVQGYDADTAKTDTAQTWTAKQTFTSAPKLQQALEKVTITADNPAATTNFDWLTQAVEYYTVANDTNWTLNVRGDGSTTLDSLMATGEAITIVVIVTNTGTAYYQSAMTIDGNAVTPQWMGAPAPTAGTVNARDTYTHTIIKTGSATFIVQSAFAGGN
jgi:hypothetical protein